MSNSVTTNDRAYFEGIACVFSILFSEFKPSDISENKYKERMTDILVNFSNHQKGKTNA